MSLAALLHPPRAGVAVGSALWANPNQGANASLWGQPMPVAAPPSGLGYTFGPEVRVRARVRASPNPNPNFSPLPSP